MRSIVTLILFALTVGCSGGTAMDGGTGTGGGSGATGGGSGATGGGGSATGGGDAGTSDSGVVDAGHPVVPNDDPTNPNITHPTCNVGECTDFPPSPIMGAAVPGNVTSLFGAPGNFTPGSLCVLEPQLSSSIGAGAMMPANWVRPRVRFSAPALDVFEIRLHSIVEVNDLVVYTRKLTWYVPAAIWSSFANNAAGAPVTVTVRGIDSTNPGTPVGSQGDFNVAPVKVGGSVQFSTAVSAALTPTSSQVLGFNIGDEGSAATLTLPSLAWNGVTGEDGAELRGYYDSPKLAGFVDGQVRCIGCHTVMPDGEGDAYTDSYPWSQGAALFDGGVPASIGAGAQALMKMPWLGSTAFSAAHFSAGDRALVTSYGVTFTSGMARTNPWQALPYYNTMIPSLNDVVKWHSLAWIDLESTAAINVAVTDTPDYGQSLTGRENAATAAMGTAWGLIATGDTGVSDVSPAVNHRGDTIAYVTTNTSPDGHPDYTATTADLRVVAYNPSTTGKPMPMGGPSQPLTGAADPAKLEYDPDYSADDALIAFTRAPQPSATSPDGPYTNRFGEVSVVSADGGVVTRLSANDPNACAGDNVSAGLINSHGRWSPQVIHAHGKAYYFLVFTSARKYGDELTQQFQISPVPQSPVPTHASSQLYIAALVADDAMGTFVNYPAVLVWNQSRVNAMGVQFSSLTPTWSAKTLPPTNAPPVPDAP